MGETVDKKKKAPEFIKAPVNEDVMELQNQNQQNRKLLENQQQNAGKVQNEGAGFIDDYADVKAGQEQQIILEDVRRDVTKNMPSILT